MKKESAVLYTVIGILIGVIFMLLIYQLPPKTAVAAAKTDAMGGAAGGMIAIASQTSSDANILWVLDTTRKSLALYDLNIDEIRLKSARDIQYDIDLADGVSYSSKGGSKTVTPGEVKIKMAQLKEELEKQKKENPK
ncbi:MAG: hypothetical protein V1701_05870 [Planctomycetota bacterium]